VIFIDGFSKKFPAPNLMKISPVVPNLFYWEGQTDRQANYFGKSKGGGFFTGSEFNSSRWIEEIHRSADMRPKVWTYLFNDDVHRELSREQQLHLHAHKLCIFYFSFLLFLRGVQDVFRLFFKSKVSNIFETSLFSFMSARS